MTETKQTETAAAQQTRCQSVHHSLRHSFIHSYIHSLTHSGIALVKSVEAWFEPRKYISLVNFLNSSKNTVRREEPKPTQPYPTLPNLEALAGFSLKLHPPCIPSLSLLPCLSSRQMLKCGARVRTPQNESKSWERERDGNTCLTLQRGKLAGCLAAGCTGWSCYLVWVQFKLKPRREKTNSNI